MLGVSRWEVGDLIKATPYQWARIFGKQDVLQLLDKRMAKLNKQDRDRFRRGKDQFHIGEWAVQNRVEKKIRTH